VRIVVFFFISHGFAIPVIIALLVAVFMTFSATRTVFGRYVYAIGGNPEAAELAGVDTRRITIRVFTIMGILCAVSAIIATARLNAAAIALGTTDELYVIAATVIGGTSLAGGVGRITGTFIGTIILGVVTSGFTFLQVGAYYQEIVKGIIIVAAVVIDQYRQNLRRKA